MNPEDKIADAAYTTARATVDAGDKIVAAIDRNTDEVRRQGNWIFVALIGILVTSGCPRAKAAPLISDGDEIASIGTVQVITPHTLPERKI